VDLSKKLQASRVINAPAENIFALLADPNRHSEFDDTDTMRGPEEDVMPIAEVGQTFTMNKHQPDIGDYRTVNKVVAFMSPSRIGWGPILDPSSSMAKELGEINASGHTYTYDVEEVEGGTNVTLTLDWTGVKDPDFEALFPVVSQEQLARTLDRIADVVRAVDDGAAARGAAMAELPAEVSFELNIQPLFSQRDREGMQIMFDLWNHESVRDHADGILDQLDAGRMPCYGSWPKEQVALFRRWKEGGMLP
jgi:hypothetical protein